MGSYIAVAQKNIVAIATRLTQTGRHSLRFALVCYRRASVHILTAETSKPPITIVAIGTTPPRRTLMLCACSNSQTGLTHDVRLVM
jgi:hypothetical protein